jgi:hypothetical protein
MSTRLAATIVLVLGLLGCGDDTDTDIADAAIPVDGAPAVSADAAPGVSCLGADCTTAQVCCREVVLPGDPATYCVPEEPSCTGTAFSCDGPEDCAGEDQCCSTGDGVRCVPSGTCPESIVCHTAVDCPAGACCPTPIGVVKACQGAS